MDLRSLDATYDEELDWRERGSVSLSIGASYYNEGLASDDQAAFEIARAFYEKSLSFGNPQAAVNLGYMYQYGRLGEEDMDTAFDLYQRAAFCEFPEAMYKVADMLYWRNVPCEDKQHADEQAFRLYMKAHRLAQGMSEPDWLGSAAFRLGGCFEYGRGCERDPLLAADYYLQAITYFDFAIDDGFGYYRKNRCRCQRAVDRLREKELGLGHVMVWRPLPAGAQSDGNGFFRVEDNVALAPGNYRTYDCDFILVSEEDVAEARRVDGRSVVAQELRVLEFNLALSGNLDNRSLVRITFDEFGVALEQELGLVGQRQFLQLGVEEADELRNKLHVFDLAAWDDFYEPYGPGERAGFEWSMEALSDTGGFSSKGSDAWPYHLPLLFEELSRFGIANMWTTAEAEASD